MTRVKSPTTRKKRKLLKKAKGFRQARRKRIRVAKEAILHAGEYAYVGRKLKKRNLRALWITRLNAKVREHGLSYSEFISKLKKENIELDKKILAEIAVKDSDTFTKILKELK